MQQIMTCKIFNLSDKVTQSTEVTTCKIFNLQNRIVESGLQDCDMYKKNEYYMNNKYLHVNWFGEQRLGRENIIHVDLV